MWLFSWLFTPKPKPAFKRWPTTTVTYGFREKREWDRFVFPEEYRELVIESAREWTGCTIINLVHQDFDTDPEPDIIFSIRMLPKGYLGFGYFPGKTARCGDIDLDFRDWFEDHAKSYLKTIIMHEFGHALGLRHSRYTGSIMYRHPGVSRIHSFDIENLNEGYEDDARV